MHSLVFIGNFVGPPFGLTVWLSVIPLTFRLRGRHKSPLTFLGMLSLVSREEPLSFPCFKI